MLFHLFASLSQNPELVPDVCGPSCSLPIMFVLCVVPRRGRERTRQVMQVLEETPLILITPGLCKVKVNQPEHLTPSRGRSLLKLGQSLRTDCRRTFVKQAITTNDLAFLRKEGGERATFTIKTSWRCSLKINFHLVKTHTPREAVCCGPWK